MEENTRLREAKEREGNPGWILLPRQFLFLEPQAILILQMHKPNLETSGIFRLSRVVFSKTIVKKFWDLEIHLQPAKSHPRFLAKAVFHRQMLLTAEMSFIQQTKIY